MDNRILRIINRLVCELIVTDSFKHQIDLDNYTHDKVCKKWGDLMIQFQKRHGEHNQMNNAFLAEEIYSFDNKISLLYE